MNELMRPCSNLFLRLPLCALLRAPFVLSLSDRGWGVAMERGKGSWLGLRFELGFGCESNWTGVSFGLPLAHCVQWKMETCFPQVAHTHTHTDTRTHMQSCMPQLVAAGFCCCGCLKCRVAFCLRARPLAEGGRQRAWRGVAKVPR